ncbi:MAG: hypothetical protein R2681_08440 [Pyrinomonadaceae bacterium]
MKKRSYKFYIRKSHRYLGIFIGVQFLFWTLGGLYFSWTDINEIRGDLLRKETPEIDLASGLISPDRVLEEIKTSGGVAKVENMRVVQVFGLPFYEFTVRGSDGNKRMMLADVTRGKIRPPVSKVEARQIADQSLAKPLNFTHSEYLTKENVSRHHEYREKPLPAWAITYENGLTVYLGAENGQIEAFRTNKWRVFDFLWMMHTMDFAGRDNINNYLLRGFSILGIATILSGFALFFASSRLLKRKRKTS